MNHLQLKPSYKVVQGYYDEIRQLGNLNLFHEGAVSPSFASLLRYCARQFNWTLAEQYHMKPHGKPIIVDGALLDQFKLLHGVWEAKDSQDDLDREVKKKFRAGYPKDNVLFQAPEQIIIWQNNKEIINEDISKPEYLVEALRLFFKYQPPQFDQWNQAAEEFKHKVPELGKALLDIIENERKINNRFIKAFDDFANLCRTAINPNLSIHAVIEMLIQHLLTERLFRKVFDYSDFAKRNIIANEIEKVILSLTSHYFSRHEFLKKLDRFYFAIETTASTIDDYSQKQTFLNTIYEKFFQGFSVKVADTHGIVYTPQPIVGFIVKSVEYILQKEFGHSLSDKGVNILEPFVGTGNFIVRIMREINRIALPYKYKNELNCNEVMLLPYYIASMNIEHEYFELIGNYKPFEGICLVDTFELAEDKQMSLFTAENTQRVIKQKFTPIFVVVGNPPYNVGQINENDNRKNRKYPEMDKRISGTYAKDSKASLVSQLSDPYVKAIRYATDRIEDEGIVAFITNSSFVDRIAFDGMRKHLEKDFNKIFILDLGGNVRKNPKLSGTTHNVFGIQVGVSINFFIKKKSKSKKDLAKIYYAQTDEFWRKEQKYEFLNSKIHIDNIKWKKINPDKKYNWLTKGLKGDFEKYMPIGTKSAKYTKDVDVQSIFKIYSCGVTTNRDQWVYSFQKEQVVSNVKKFISNYNSEIYRYFQESKSKTISNIDSFVNNDGSFLKWTDRLKNSLIKGQELEFDKKCIRKSLYRPFTKEYFYFHNLLTHRRYQQHFIFPTPNTEEENQVICLTAIGNPKPFHCLATNVIPNLHLTGDSQSFPFYVYDENGKNRQENITDWALDKFRNHYKEGKISKLSIFHYVYAILHHPKYRSKYVANLKIELPRIPFLDDFWTLSSSGKKLMELHGNYENSQEYPLELKENKSKPLSWRIEKMKLSNDKASILYNEFLTLNGIPPEVFNYRLGNRSALEWIIEQYCIKTDKRSGIVNDPNLIDDPQYIVRLINKLVTVSLKTVEIINNLPSYN